MKGDRINGYAPVRGMPFMVMMMMAVYPHDDGITTPSNYFGDAKRSQPERRRHAVELCGKDFCFSHNSLSFP